MMDYNQMRISHCYHYYLTQIIICLSTCVIHFNGIQFCSAAMKVPVSSTEYYHGRGNPPGERFPPIKLEANGVFDLLKLNNSRLTHFHLLEELNDQEKVINKTITSSSFAKDQYDSGSEDHSKRILNLTKDELLNNLKNDLTTVHRYKNINDKLDLLKEKRTKRCSTNLNTLSAKQMPLNLRNTNSEKRKACCEIINKLIAEAFKIQNNCKCASDVALDSTDSNSEMVENIQGLTRNENKDNRNIVNSDKMYTNDDDNSLVKIESAAPQETKLQTKRNNYIEPTADGLEVHDYSQLLVNDNANKQDEEYEETDDAYSRKAPLKPMKLKANALSEETTIKAIINDSVQFIYTESSKHTQFEAETERNQFTSDLTKKLLPETLSISEEDSYENEEFNNEALEKTDSENSEVKMVKYVKDNEDLQQNNGANINSEKTDLSENQINNDYLKPKEKDPNKMEYTNELNFNNEPNIGNIMHDDKLSNTTDEINLKAYDIDNKMKENLETNRIFDTITNNKSHYGDIQIYQTDIEIQNYTKLPFNISHYNIEVNVEKVNDDLNKSENTSQQSDNQTHNNDYIAAKYQATSTKSIPEMMEENKIVGDIWEACRNYYARNNEHSQTLSPFDILLCTSTKNFNNYIGKELITVNPMKVNDDYSQNEDIYHNASDFTYDSKNTSEVITINNLLSENNKLTQNMFQEQQILNSLVTDDKIIKTNLTNTTITDDDQSTLDTYTILGMPVTEIIDIDYNSPMRLRLENPEVSTETLNEFDHQHFNNEDYSKIKHIQNSYEITTSIPLIHLERTINNDEIINEPSLENRLNNALPFSSLTNSKVGSDNNTYITDFTNVSYQDYIRNESDSENDIGSVYKIDAMTHDTSTTANVGKNITLSYNTIQKNMVTTIYDDAKSSGKGFSTMPNYIYAQLFKPDMEETNTNENLDYKEHKIAETNSTSIQQQEYTDLSNGSEPQNTDSDDVTKNDVANEHINNNSNETKDLQFNENFENDSVPQPTNLHDPVVNVQNVLDINGHAIETNVTQPVTKTHPIYTIQNESQEFDTSVQQRIHVFDLNTTQENIITENRLKSNDSKFDTIDSKDNPKDIYFAQISKINDVADTQEFATISDMNQLQEIILRTTTNGNQSDYVTVAPIEQDRLASDIKSLENYANDTEGGENNTVNHEHIYKTNEITFESQEPVAYLNDVNIEGETYTIEPLQVATNFVQGSTSEKSILNDTIVSTNNYNKTSKLSEIDIIELSSNQKYENNDTIQAIISNDATVTDVNSTVNLKETDNGTQDDPTSESSINYIQVVNKNPDIDLKYHKESNTVTIIPQITISSDMVTKQYNNIIYGQNVTDSTDSSLQEQQINEYLQELPDNIELSNSLVQNVDNKTGETEENSDLINLLPSVGDINVNSDKTKGHLDSTIQDKNQTDDYNTPKIPLQIQHNEEYQKDEFDLPELIPLGIVSDLNAIDDNKNTIPAILHLPVLLTLTNLTLIDSPDSKFYIENNGSKLELNLLKSDTPKTSINPYYIFIDRLKHNNFNDDNTEDYTSYNRNKNELINRIYKRMNTNIATQGVNTSLSTPKYKNNSEITVENNLKKNYNNSNELNVTVMGAEYMRENLQSENQTFFRHSRYKEIENIPTKINFKKSVKNIYFQSNSNNDISTPKTHENNISRDLKSSLSQYNHHKNNHNRIHLNKQFNDFMFKLGDQTKPHQINQYNPYKYQINKDIYRRFFDAYNPERYRNKNNRSLILTNNEKSSQHSKRSLSKEISDTINRIKNKEHNEKFTKDQNVLDVLYTTFKRVKKLFTE